MRQELKWLAKSTDLEEFTGIVENRYSGALANGTVVQRRVLPVVNATQNQTPQNQPQSSSVNNNNDVSELLKQMQAMMKSMSGKKSRVFCAFCLTNDHTLANCVKAPPPGTCFDCLQKGHKRGDSRCTGKVQQNSD